MTQKYKKNNSPAIQNGIFPDFPDVLQPNFPSFPDVFWFRHGGNMLVAFQKKYGRPR